MKCSGKIQKELIEEVRHAEHQAWVSLARYKFVMFGYWVGLWVHLNKISGLNHPNPWSCLVKVAEEKLEE